MFVSLPAFEIFPYILHFLISFAQQVILDLGYLIFFFYIFLIFATSFFLHVIFCHASHCYFASCMSLRAECSFSSLAFASYLIFLRSSLPRHRRLFLFPSFGISLNSLHILRMTFTFFLVLPFCFSFILSLLFLSS